MNYRAILLVTGGVMVGALTFSAIGVTAQGFGDDKVNGERPGTHGYGINEGERRMEGKKYAAEVLGLAPEEIRVEIQSGKTMEEVILAQGHESIESFRIEVEEFVREKLAEEGLGQEEIDARIENHEQRMEQMGDHEQYMQNRKGHMGGNFDEDMVREHMSDRGLSEDEINERIDTHQDRMNRFSN